MKRKTVFVGLSGGVDSAVAAWRLKQQGHTVVGVFIKVWQPEWLACSWERERLDAMRVAARLGLPFLTCDAVDAYKQGVADYLIAEYQAGRTPNPDVMCNQVVKFGVFLDFATARGANYIATGHYARKQDAASGAQLRRAVDAEKDQTYFLWTLTKEQLEQSLFPIGDTPKAIVRAEAQAAGLPVADKKDSQGICFLGPIDLPEFLGHYVTLNSGAVLNTAGEQIGEHAGALVYTLGQRHGFTLTNHDAGRAGMYVVAKDLTKNTITVAPSPPAYAPSARITLRNVVLRELLNNAETLTAQFRYRQKPRAVTVVTVTKRQCVLKLNEALPKTANGQSCVLYRDNVCVGGGTIS